MFAQPSISHPCSSPQVTDGAYRTARRGIDRTTRIKGKVANATSNRQCCEVGRCHPERSRSIPSVEQPRFSCDYTLCIYRVFFQNPSMRTTPYFLKNPHSWCVYYIPYVWGVFDTTHFVCGANYPRFGQIQGDILSIRKYRNFAIFACFSYVMYSFSPTI